MSQRIPLALLAALLLAPAASAGGPYVAVKIVRGDVLEFQVVPEADYDAFKARLREESPRDPPRVEKLSGRHETEDEATAAWRAEADRIGLVPCWRCDGAGELETSGPRGPGRERCGVCRGARRVRSSGYAIVRYDYGSGWTYLFLRGAMLPHVEEQTKKYAQMQAQGAHGGGSKIEMKNVRVFRAGEFDAAAEFYEKLCEEAAGSRGFLGESAVPGVVIPAVEWPETFYAR